MTDMQTPRRVTLEELKAKTAKAIVEATEFEPSPTYDLQKGEEIFFRVKKVISGKFETPLVIVNDVRKTVNGKLAVLDTMKTSTQAGLNAQRIFGATKGGEDVRLPAFLVKRAKSQGIEFHPNQVYIALYIDDIKVEKGMFQRAAVVLAGTDFPEA